MFTSSRLLTTLAIGLANAAVTQAESLLNLNADANTVTLSGFSAGGHFSCHMMTVLSGTIKGAGCAKGAAFTSEFGDFRNGDLPETISARAIDIIDALAATGDIDPLSNLANNAVIIMSGADDPVVPATNQRAIEQIFQHYGMQKLSFIDTGNNGHRSAPDYANTMIEYLYTSLNYGEFKSNTQYSLDGGWEQHGTQSTFDQTEFYTGVDWDDKDFDGRENGYIFVPTKCSDGTISQCKIHFSLHGCGGRPNGKFEAYNEVAALNNIIMIYPDTRCWDNHADGIDPQNYMKKTGIVPSAFKAMIERVTGGTGGTGGNGSACTEYDSQINAALANIEEIRQYLAGDVTSYTIFDPSSVPLVIPTGCSPQQTAADVRTKQLEIVNSDNFQVDLFNRTYWTQ